MRFVTFSALKAICFLIFVLVASTSSQSQNNTTCPFKFDYFFGDSAADTGNSVDTPIFGSRLPAANNPYGITFPGRPTGRWSDGRLISDYAAQALGIQGITNYLSQNTSSANAIVFAVARSPVLDRSFFLSRRIQIPLYTVSLNGQINWLKRYLNNIYRTPTDRTNALANALMDFGDKEANDITYSLIQRKSIQEVQSYIPHIIRAQIDAARDVIRLGATRILIAGNAPMGCYPFVLTELASNNPNDYDNIGCLRSVNNLIVSKNDALQEAIRRLQMEFPRIFIIYFDFYNLELSILQQTVIPGNISNLSACCGIGGRYNYDNNRFCGSRGVPVCSDPNQYFFWDGMHLTQEANNRIVESITAQTLPILNCTVL